jgi:hypothetical protein
MRHHHVLAALGAAVAALAMPADAQAAPDDTFGMAMLAARVNSDGTLASGSGATAAFKTSPGSYRVDFDRDVSGCYYSANNSGYNASPLYAVTLPADGFPNRIWVLLFNNDGFADGSFYLLVYCAR